MIKYYALYMYVPYFYKAGSSEGVFYTIVATNMNNMKPYDVMMATMSLDERNFF